jgi:nucleotide-binding universal stress UspA family protein
MKLKPAAKKGKILLELGTKDSTLLKALPFALRRILVPVDFSDTARKAIQYAAPFAAAFDAEVTLVHVIQPFSVPVELGYIPPDLADTQQELMKSAREELGKICARELGTRSRYQVQVREGVPWQELVAAARETDTDLIILATHGRTGLKYALLGSVAERVVRHAPCPVLVVRDRERDFVTTTTHAAPVPV